jgi:competence protein ComFC
MNFLDTILNVIFPVRCISCGKNGEDLCTACLSNFPSAERESAKWIFPIFDYRHPPIKKAIWLLKYNGKKRLAGIFAEVVHGKILEELSDLSVMENFNEPVLIPIPLSLKRRRERGFNQAGLICNKLIKLDKGSNFKLEDNVLIKPKDTEHQARIRDRSERLKNLSGSFAVKNANLIKGRNLILIDDVTTTGATLNEAKKILKQNGAKKIIAFCVAH